ncbi:MAG: hypothetical protein GY797_27475 [Deltaproteobacteria bacterium]|nr:hypothetical protein [Deltaproteobacteria bacterium]
MSIKIGIYDFFAYTIPGGIYLVSVIYLGYIFQSFNLDFATVDLVPLLIFVALSYVVGLILNPISRMWYRFFKPENISQITFEKFQDNNFSFKFNFETKDIPILVSYIKQNDMDVASEMGQFNAMHIMLRNVSLSLVFLAIIQVLFLISKFSYWGLIVAVIFFGFSILAVKQSAKYEKWYYSNIYETLLAHNLTVSDLITRSQSIDSGKSKNLD